MSRTLKSFLEKEQRRIEQARTVVQPIRSIYDAFTRCSPDLIHPKHLQPYVDALENGMSGEGLKLCFAAPPQHGKTEVAKHAFILADQLKPGYSHAYCTYNAERARGVREQVKKLAYEAGLQPRTSGQSLYFGNDTTVQFVGRGGGLTGHKVNGLLIIDDILKDRAEASSPTIRENCWEWFTDVARTRSHPGSSQVVMMTRWSTDDLTARLTNEFDWPYIRLAAECDSDDDPNGRQIGEALWEQMRPIEWLQQFKDSPMTWASMYQGHPRPLGDSLFQQNVHYYDQLPAKMYGYKNVHGCDLAYEPKKSADWSVLLSARVWQGDVYITNMIRQQKQADVFTAMMAAHVREAPGPVLWHGSSSERGLTPFITRQIPSFFTRLATTNKYVRAVPTAERLWNRGKIFLPSGAPWVKDFVSHVIDFTGEGGGLDDEVDALASLGDLAIETIEGSGANELNRKISKIMSRGGLRLVG